MTRGDSQKGRRANPFDGELARANSSYAAFRGGRLARVPSGEFLTLLAEAAHGSFRAFVLDPEFSCVGAKSAIRRGCYRVGVYGDLDTPGSTAGLARDLFSFVEDREEIGGRFRTFVALFKEPGVEDEWHFERIREEGKLPRMQEVIRARELSLQGSLNPNLGALDAFPEARQYSGRPADEGWACPFGAVGMDNEEEIR